MVLKNTSRMLNVIKYICATKHAGYGIIHKSAMPCALRHCTVNGKLKLKYSFFYIHKKQQFEFDKCKSLLNLTYNKFYLSLLRKISLKRILTELKKKKASSFALIYNVR